MTALKAHVTYLETENGELTDKPLAFIHPASAESVDAVLSAPEDCQDGRSQFVWVRLANGDLVLGVYPQGDTYFAVEVDAAYPGPGVQS